MTCASCKKASGDMVPGFRVLMATPVVPFHVPDGNKTHFKWKCVLNQISTLWQKMSYPSRLLQNSPGPVWCPVWESPVESPRHLGPDLWFEAFVLDIHRSDSDKGHQHVLKETQRKERILNRSGCMLWMVNATLNIWPFYHLTYICSGYKNIYELPRTPPTRTYITAA